MNHVAYNGNPLIIIMYIFFGDFLFFIIFSLFLWFCLHDEYNNGIIYITIVFVGKWWNIICEPELP